MLDLDADAHRLLEAHLRSQRGEQETLDNLEHLLLHRRPTEAERNKFFATLSHLFQVELHRTRVRNAAGQALETNPLDIIFRLFGKHGPVERFAKGTFQNIDVCSQVTLRRWLDEGLPSFTRTLHLFGTKFAPETLYEINRSVDAYLETRCLAMIPLHERNRFIAAMEAVRAAVDEVKLRTFEQEIRGAQSTADANDSLLESTPISATIVGALSEAGQYVHSGGKFDPKKAADLLRTAIDEAHREIATRLGEITGIPYSGAESDGQRRAYMRQVGFLSSAEEKFFSAIYTLLSEEASHKLIAPRETVVLLHLVVQSYIFLLGRRLAAFPSSTAS